MSSWRKSRQGIAGHRSKKAREETHPPQRCNASLGGLWPTRQDSNLRPQESESCALSSWATGRYHWLRTAFIIAHFSPDCKHFSKAKGAKPVDKNIRGLAWVALRWAGLVHPRVIILENVEEFQTWGPVRKGKPVKSKSGQTFRKFIRQLRGLGYAVEWRELIAADYGAPTTRKRFFLVARCDGRPIVWPKPTHAPRDSDAVNRGELLPWRGAAEIFHWKV